MSVREGTHVLGPGDGTVLVRTGREGPAARVGHDVTLRATRWSATVTVVPDDLARSEVRAEIDASSFEVVEATGGAMPLTDSQRREVEQNTRDRVLQASAHPTITFSSTEVRGDDSRAVVVGDVSMRRRSREVVLDVRARRRGEEVIVTAFTELAQTDFGIKPYTAMLGTLRVTDVVAITVELRLPAG